MEYVEIARIKGAHGIRGELRVALFNPDTPHVRSNAVVYLQRDGRFEPVRVLAATPLNKGVRLRLEGVATRSEAEAMFDLGLYLPREQFAPVNERENYVVDLIGMAVADAESGEIYGKLGDVLPTGAHDCYVVTREGKPDLLIPVTDEVVAEVDLDGGRVRVRLPEGLLELYEN